MKVTAPIIPRGPGAKCQSTQQCQAVPSIGTGLMRADEGDKPLQFVWFLFLPPAVIYVTVAVAVAVTYLVQTYAEYRHAGNTAKCASVVNL